ncbi:MAG: hypothetical protein JJ959_01980 [Nisaea sp.]|uniref:hypothetical protein n=1 Tax=Nisaea sp. TaxID=2024842 RepID=UPI001B2A16F7|nr:hypothetical protein [Nisaea sp.]MBO6559270.1 hypothetical protein [Nisaea sp.]
MPFETLSDRLKMVAMCSLNHCKARYGGNGVKVEQGLSEAIMWRPSYYLKAGKYKIIAVEVEDNLYPESLKGAAYEISHYEMPVSVYQACSLESYQGDPKHKKVNLLRSHGFGIITVDDDGNVVIQHNCVPLAQHISPDVLEREIRSLSKQLKVAFRSAHDVYHTNEGQGLQDAGQIIEAMISELAKQAHKKNVVSNGTLSKPLGSQIDDLYAANAFNNHRAALGGARDFIKEFRNTASHPPKSAKQAAEKIRKCRKGFLDAIVIASKLKAVSSALGYQMRIHTT